MDTKPLILLAAGGTGGHLFPAEALGVELIKRGYRVRLATDDRALRYSGLFTSEMTDVVPSETVRSRNPISLARLVMTETPHVLLVGTGAEAFADEMRDKKQIVRVPNSYFSTERRRREWEETERDIEMNPILAASAHAAVEFVARIGEAKYSFVMPAHSASKTRVNALVGAGIHVFLFVGRK